MAIVTIKPYHDIFAAQSVNSYISDGHGGGACLGYKCPMESAKATEYMDTLRELWNYHKGPSMADATHYQLWFSFADGERPLPMEMLDMAGQLIDRTTLRDYACYISAHLNTDIRHIHISVCPYPDSITGDRLTIGDALKHELWRQADYICAEHGYSIIDNPTLRQDKRYNAWFEQIKSDGLVKIRPMSDAQCRPLSEQISAAEQRATRTPAAQKERADR